MIIIINGPARSGKDTFVKLFSEVSDSKVINLSTIDDVKILAQCMGWDPESKSEKDRQLLSDLKDLWIRYNNGPFNSIKMKISMGRMLHRAVTAKTDECHQGIIFFVHCREPEEIKKLVDYYQSRVLTFLINRPDIAAYNNHSDQNTDKYPYDFIIDNSGDLERLKKQIPFFANLLDKEARWLRTYDQTLQDGRSKNIWPDPN